MYRYILYICTLAVRGRLDVNRMLPTPLQQIRLHDLRFLLMLYTGLTNNVVTVLYYVNRVCARSQVREWVNIQMYEIGERCEERKESN